MKYTSLERVKAVLDHKEADRVPFDLGGSAVTGINKKSLTRLRKYLGLPEKEIQICSTISQLGFVDDDLADRLKVDVRAVDPKPSAKKGLEKDIWLDNEHYKLIDKFGIGWKMPVNHGHYFDAYYHPFENFETEAEVNEYPWPDPQDNSIYQSMREEAATITEKEKRAYVLGRYCSGMWETALWMCGYEKFLCDMMLNEKFVHAVMTKFTELKMRYWERALEETGDSALVISEADDLATQNSLLISLDLYKKMIWPYHKRLFEFIKKKAKSKVYIFFHNDGACAPTIPLLIEAGVDILNPVQVNCVGMDTKVLKREFGKDITFWGALCDTQFVLPFGTTDQVREETKRRVEDLMKDGGWIAAPIHNIQSDVPPENIMAMWETLQENGVYR